MRVFVLGATGFIGRHIVEGLAAQGSEVIAITRSIAKGLNVLGNKATIIEGDPNKSGPWQDLVDGCDAAIIMTGEPIVGKKWTPQRKQMLLDSRLKPTANVIDA